MGIPYRFDPLGTLGKGEYISDGLVLCILSEHEQAGKTLTNLVDGTVYQSITHTKTDAGALAFISNTTESILPRGAVPFSPENSIELIAHVKSGTLLFDCYLNHHKATGGIASLTAYYGQVARNTSNDEYAWRSHLGSDFFDKPYHFCLNSDNSNPVLVNATSVAFTIDRHSWIDSVETLLSSYKSCCVDISAIRIYNRALSLEEVSHNFNVDKKKYNL